MSKPWERIQLAEMDNEALLFWFGTSHYQWVTYGKAKDDYWDCRVEILRRLNREKD